MSLPGRGMMVWGLCCALSSALFWGRDLGFEKGS